jgi:hypothetical protein
MIGSTATNPKGSVAVDKSDLSLFRKIILFPYTNSYFLMYNSNIKVKRISSVFVIMSNLGDDTQGMGAIFGSLSPSGV